MEDTQRKIEETNPDEAIKKLVEIIDKIESELRDEKGGSENSYKSHKKELAIYNKRELLSHVFILLLGIFLLLLCFISDLIVKVKFFVCILVGIVFSIIFVLRFLLS